MLISKKKFNLKLNGVQTLALGFLILIFIGGTILSLPIASADGNFTNYLDSVFTATSAVCVTGLVTVDTGTHWNTFGKVIVILLIQVGGLGFMCLSTFLAVILGKKITLKERLLVQESMNAFDIQGLVKMVTYVIKFTFSVELIGAIILSTQLIPEFGVVRGILYSLFHSISAFCNAGFDLFGHFESLTNHNTNSVILITIATLIILGGLGFTVISELYKYPSQKIKRLSLHSKVVLSVTAVLIIGGTLGMLLLEYNNPETLGVMGLKDKLLNAYFAAVTPRTAGFNSISTDVMTGASKFLTIILMFIGGSPGSTAGGIKTATFGIIVLTVVSVIKGREDTEVFGRHLSKETVYKAFALLIIAMSLVTFVTMILTITESKEKFIDLLYEATSAFGTVGITTGVTQRLSTIGKILIAITMYLGRVGPLTVALALTTRKRGKGFKYPEGKILIG